MNELELELRAVSESLLEQSSNDRTAGRALMIIREIRKRQVELEQENQELRTLAARLEADRLAAVERFREMTEQIDEVLFLLCPAKPSILYLSPAFERVLGRAPQELVDAPGVAIEWVHPDDRPRARQAIERARLGEPIDLQLRLLRIGTKIRTVRVRAHSTEAGRIAGVFSDTTDERRLEEELRQAQKMEAIGTLASGVAHDFNNMLMGVIGLANVAQLRMEPTAPGHREVARIAEIARRGQTLTRQLVDFSRKQPSRADAIDLDATILSCQSLLETLVGESVRVTVNADAGGSRVRAEAGEIEQILMNLATNARDAMPEGGMLSISSQEVFTAEKAELPSSRHVKIVVQDTGCGMDDATRRRIFEPFFTTKKVGQGTGLGLSTTFALVRRLGGTIRTGSSPGKGTTFIISLPSVPETSELPVPEVSAKGHGIVLVVEDDPYVRESVGYYLGRLGFTPLLASDRDQAMRLADVHGDALRLLLVDVMMPQQLGPDLANELRTRVRGAQVVYMSAHEREELVARGRIEPGATLLQKPFEEQRLAIALRSVLKDQDAHPDRPASGPASGPASA